MSHVGTGIAASRMDLTSWPQSALVMVMLKLRMPAAMGHPTDLGSKMEGVFGGVTTFGALGMTMILIAFSAIAVTNGTAHSSQLIICANAATILIAGEDLSATLRHLRLKYAIVLH